MSTPDARVGAPRDGRWLTGIGASPGIAIGRAHIVDRRRIKTPKRHIVDAEVADELERLEAALATSDEQLERIKIKLREREGDDHFQIIEAHQLILHDEHLVVPTRRRIVDDKVNAEWALRRTVEEIKSVFDSIEEDYFRERRSDIDFVGDRILRNLLGEQVDAVGVTPPGAIVIAHDLSPADTAHLHRSSCAAFVTDAGGKTSHSAIIARAREIPAVVGVEHATERIVPGALLIVDGGRGEVLVNPTPGEVEEYRARGRRLRAFVGELMQNRDLPAETTDAARVRLFANVEITDEIPSAIDHGAEGIGLYRTEFLYLDRSDLPREEEHFMHARGVLRRLSPYPATFRTFDLGGDKVAAFASRFAIGHEANPALGLRSIRLCLKERGLFKTQLRGLLRASAHGRARIMFPMISGVGELRAAKGVLEEAKSELRREGLPFDEKIPVGIMVEMPSAALTADLLARECDFLSIGTNDLIQYALAIDRVNEHVGYLYHPLHPALLRMVRYIVDAGHAVGIRVGMCGEMAGEPMFALVLCGLGLDELSMNPTSIPVVKSVVRSSTMEESRKLASEVLALATVEEIEAHVQRTMAARFSEDLLRAAGELGQLG
jgi:phosphotransferase system enzyme I (PtsI)